MYVNSALSDNKCICRKDLFKVYINDLIRGRTCLEATRNFDNLKKPIDD